MTVRYGANGVPYLKEVVKKNVLTEPALVEGAASKERLIEVENQNVFIPCEDCSSDCESSCANESKSKKGKK